jgi:hypothetical protein
MRFIYVNFLKTDEEEVCLLSSLNYSLNVHTFDP